MHHKYQVDTNDQFVPDSTYQKDTEVSNSTAINWKEELKKEMKMYQKGVAT